MKNNKQIVLLSTIFVLVFLSGAMVMRVWDTYRAYKNLSAEQLVPGQKTDSLLMVNMEKADLPADMREAEPEPEPELATSTQLAKINIPGLERVISRTGHVVEVEDGKGPSDTVVDIGDAKYVTLPVRPATPQDQAAAQSQISMIAAPVEVKLIRSLDEYKEFKRYARGTYPQANFKKEQVVVLESTSNLPDKMFEIQDVYPEKDKYVVTYRVSVFGLDKKINTHTAALMPRTDLPIQLKQVL